MNGCRVALFFTLLAPAVIQGGAAKAAALSRKPLSRHGASAPRTPESQLVTLGAAQGPITIRADRLDGSLGTGPVVASGHVLVTRGTLTIRADMASYDPGTRALSASGHVEIDTQFGVIDAADLKYDVTSGGGSGSALLASVEGFSLRADRFQLVPPAAPDQAVVVIAQNGALTSCTFDHPDYLLTAHWIRLQPRDSVRMQGMSAWLFGARLISLPYVSFSLRPKRRGEARSSVPGIGFGVITGPFVHWTTGTRIAAGINSKEEVVLSTRMGVTGGMTLQQVGGTPLQFSLYHRYEIPRYQFSRLTIDKTPELRVPFGRSFAVSPGYVTMVGEGVAGHYREYSHTASGSRLMLREAALWRPGRGYSHPLLGAGLTSSFYSGHSYAIGGAEAGYEAQISRDIHAAAILSTNATAGHTPFAFDVLEAYRTFELTAASDNVKWGWNLDAIYDIQHHRLYDGQITLAHTLKCIRPSIGFQLRNRQVLFSMTIPAITNLEPRRPAAVFTPGGGVPAYTWREGDSLPEVTP